jgi:hypothetical protein
MEEYFCFQGFSPVNVRPLKDNFVLYDPEIMEPE